MGHSSLFLACSLAACAPGPSSSRAGGQAHLPSSHPSTACRALPPPPAGPAGSSAARRTTRATAGRSAWPSATTGKPAAPAALLLRLLLAARLAGKQVARAACAALPPTAAAPSRSPRPRPRLLFPVSPRCRSELFREYAIADLSRYREGKVGLRWRTQCEVVSGRGQFVCGAKVIIHPAHPSGLAGLVLASRCRCFQCGSEWRFGGAERLAS